jgi:sec-independent protein translocase protein TatA
MFGFHWAELLVVLGIAVMIFGPKRLPEIGGAMGRGLRDFRHGLHEVKEEAGIDEIKNDVRDVRDSVRNLPHESNGSAPPVETVEAGAGGSAQAS